MMLGKHLTLGFSNPNFAGMWLMHFFIYSFLCVADKSANKLLRAICVIMIPAIVYLIVLTKARSALLGIVVMGVYYILLKIIKNNALKRFVVFFALIFPLIFAYAYQLLLDSDWFIQAFEFMASEGKELDSRLGVWLPAMDAIRSSPIWGDYSGISHGTGMSQMHNIHLDVFASYGVITGVCFI